MLRGLVNAAGPKPNGSEHQNNELRLVESFIKLQSEGLIMSDVCLQRA